MHNLLQIKLNSQRQSNMELLRIVAMFLVLVVHADFAALGHPTHADAVNETMVTIWRYVFEGLAIVCVNVFVLLSGWFGIRPTWRGFFKFIFQVAFFSIGLFVLGLCMGWSEFSWGNLASAITFTNVPATECIPLYWFIISYMGLYLFAPVLNAFVEHASKHKLGAVTLAFFAFQTLYGWLIGNEWTIFKDGYSTFSFMGLYLLAQYVRKYPMKWTQLAAVADLGIYVFTGLLIAAIGFAGVWFKISGLNTLILAYSNPLVILESLFLLLFFSKIKIQSPIINFIGGSAFSVFLVHLNPNFYFAAFKRPICYMDANYSPAMATLMILAYMLAIYVASVLVDQVRAILWNNINNHHK